jgi:hypothetical protein
MKTLAAHHYSVKSVRTFTGHEGQGFSAVLYRGDVPVADLIDDANGGELSINWRDYAAARVPGTYRTYMNMELTRMMTSEEAILWRSLMLCTEPYTHVESEVDGIVKRHYMYEDAESFCNRLVDVTIDTKRYNRLLKSKPVVQKPDGSVAHFKAKATEEVFAQLRKQFPQYKLLNTMLVCEAHAILRAAGV